MNVVCLTNHIVRKALNLSLNEMAVLCDVKKMSQNPNYGYWCIKSKEKIADWLDISRATVFNCINSLEKKGYIIKSNIGIKPSQFIIDLDECHEEIGVYIKSNNITMVSKIVNEALDGQSKIYTTTVQNLDYDSLKFRLRQSKIYTQDNNIDNNIEINKDIALGEREKKTKISEKNILVDFSSFQNGNNCNGKKENPPCSAQPPLSLEERDALFYGEVMAFDGKYTQEMLVNFYNYWSESTVDRKMMKKEIPQRGQKHATWDTSKRLATWSSRETKNHVTNNIKNKKSSIREQIEQYDRISDRIDSGNF